MNSVIRENPYNIKIVRPNKKTQQMVTNDTIKKIACKKCGRVKEEDNTSDYCLKCEQLFAYKKQKVQFDEENTAEVDGVSLVSPNEMTNNDFQNWITQTQKIKFADTLKK